MKDLLKFLGKVVTGNGFQFGFNIFNGLNESIKNKDFVALFPRLFLSILKALEAKFITLAELGADKLKSRIGESTWLFFNQLGYFANNGNFDPIAIRAFEDMANKRPLSEEYKAKYRTAFTETQQTIEVEPEQAK